MRSRSDVLWMLLLSSVPVVGAGVLLAIVKNTPFVVLDGVVLCCSWGCLPLLLLGVSSIVVLGAAGLCF